MTQKFFFLQSEEQAIDFIEQVCPQLMSQQLVICQFGGLVGQQMLRQVLCHCMERTGRLYLAIQANTFEQDIGFQEFSRLGGRRFFLQQKLQPRSDFEAAVVAEASLKPRERTETALRFEETVHRLVALFGETVEVVPEVELQADCLDLIYPLVRCYAAYAVPFIVFNPAELSIEKHVDAVAEQFRMVQAFGQLNSFLYFAFDHPQRADWDARVHNIFSGPETVDIDISNRCTHNCVFCGIYAEPVVEGNRDKDWYRHLVRQQIDTETCLELIHSLPESTRMVQFGGAGDPFIHEDFFELAQTVRKRGINLQALTNFSYLSNNRLLELSALASADPQSLNLIVNLSAATAETYQQTRGLRNADMFEKIVGKLHAVADFYQQHRRGITFWLMCVANRLNMHELPAYIALARDCGAMRVWLKPMEVHGQETLPFRIPADRMHEYARYVKQALCLADQLQVDLVDRAVLEAVVAGHRAELARHEREFSFDRQIAELRAKYALIDRGLAGKSRYPSMLDVVEQCERHHADAFSAKRDWQVKAPPQVSVEKLRPARLYEMRRQIPLGVANGEVQARYYDRNACQIGYTYTRINVDGSVLPCCVSPHTVGHLNRQSFFTMWTSGAMQAFRDKTARIAVDQFHRKDKDWLFCQQCPHVALNREYNQHAGH